MPEGELTRLDEVESQISYRMLKQLMSPRTLLGGMRLIDESSRLSGQYQDPNYLPFYFHLGRVINPARIACVGFDLGLQLSCLLKGCSSPKLAFCLQGPSGDFYSPRLALSNIRSVAGNRFPVEVHVGRPHDQRPQDIIRAGVDMALITKGMPSDDLMESMDLCWGGLGSGGAMVVDYLSQGESEDIFRDFCAGRSVRYHIFRTRYLSGMVLR